MKMFHFRMQAVLDQRERLESVAKLSLAEAEAALQRGHSLLAQLQEVRDALLAELGSRRTGGFDPMETQLYQDYLKTVAQSIRDQQQYLGELVQAREVQQLQLIRAAQNRQALVSVRDRDQSAHVRRRQQKEQNELDELATSRFNYQQRLGE